MKPAILTDCEATPQGAYLYQTFHLQRGEALRVDEHLGVIDRASRRWFGRPAGCTAAELRTAIGELARALRYPATASSFVRLRLYDHGLPLLLPGGVSLYDGYALRTLFPAATAVVYDLPFGDDPLSTREHAALAARRLAELDGAQSFLRIDSAGLVRSCDDAPLFAVEGTRIVTPSSEGSVEYALAAEAIRRRGYRLQNAPVPRSELDRFDELFYCDHRGITALGSFDGRPLMHVIAEQVAAQLR